ncbi:hypothetical protein [Denitromonas halophila]|uniref:Peptidase M41 domain-containing protein n=1 Tax=Denitromonas halophila TaxID=1629404 RepID=A0A557QJI7_9RHOO|nr:hypothetical protein [Denitromonas halophila]TVO53073.1 hypothetical protein FHP91_14810 [Denitromonas halophila]
MTSPTIPLMYLDHMPAVATLAAISSRYPSASDASIIRRAEVCLHEAAHLLVAVALNAPVGEIVVSSHGGRVWVGFLDERDVLISIAGVAMELCLHPDFSTVFTAAANDGENMRGMLESSGMTYDQAVAYARRCLPEMVGMLNHEQVWDLVDWLASRLGTHASKSGGRIRPRRVQQIVTELEQRLRLKQDNTAARIVRQRIEMLVDELRRY